MHIFLGFIVSLAGVGMVLKTEWLVENFGTSAWAEANFGYSGGTRLMHKVIGIILIFFGFMLMLNMFQGFLEATLGRVLVR